MRKLFFFLCTHVPKQRAKFTRIMESCQKKQKLETPTELSDMPDDLIFKIFSFLPFFKEDLATRFISEYGKGLWNPDPNAIFDDESLDMTCMSFVYGSLMSKDAQILDSLHLKLRKYYIASDINFLVQLGVNRSMRELRIDFFGKTLELPCCLSTCTTLKVLVLDHLNIMSVPGWFRLPSVETLQLSSVTGGSNYVPSLIRLCSVHERLVVDQNRNKDLVNINVPTLRSLSIDNKRRGHVPLGSFWINVPSLMFLNIKDTFQTIFESMPAMIKANIEVAHDQSQSVKFIESLTSTRHLCLCSPTSENPYPNGTKFSNLVHLKLCTCSAGWQNLLACMLNDAPNLRSLTLKLRQKSDVNPKKVWEKPTVVPECLSTRLEILKWRDYEGTEHEKDMVGYILANATFLQRATFSTKDRNQCDSRFSELQSMERVSEICEFVFD
ncbi:Leucine-rich repeat (LRR) family protein [Arabidopsis thaliana]|uniref:F-box/FBD/LRR-repeat protein At5g56570 n=1 Tax=Arabidopsis thaliana TaxID=3702 RepID=FDL39_ARATH|nr:Leucine-rich repeat (LRR) family protein [Arabidopsis thaliana]Q9FJV1.1 RecName: Full=F-box/FBD/LRR-repeat protein At5g56570 [Arabidopsis thaliana]AED96782.1 Leucine-rich repeat (LRR) family protein [Arabidopsis thaliana]BAB09874.1 unnamed protein product [Arabidopsis thaliana]|eukprot:NP_200468.1 Leucine-rich repeat (LRR) family protein [Arabidopsis thaliana]